MGGNNRAVAEALEATAGYSSHRFHTFSQMNLKVKGKSKKVKGKSLKGKLVSCLRSLFAYLLICLFAYLQIC